MKYFISDISGLRIGMKYNESKKKVSIGGAKKFERIIIYILENYFKRVSVLRFKNFVSGGKVRYDFKCSLKKYVIAMYQMRSEYTVHETKTLWRIMR